VHFISQNNHQAAHCRNTPQKEQTTPFADHKLKTPPIIATPFQALTHPVAFIPAPVGMRPARCKTSAKAE